MRLSVEPDSSKIKGFIMIISVIAIFYKSAPYVRRCVDSILSQEGIDFELIAVNDCSPDETLPVLLSYSDPRMKVVSHERNMGISAARNTGLQHMSGDCFCLVDGDDYLPKGALAKLAARYSENVDWVQGGYGLFTESGTLIKTNAHRNGEYKTHEEICRNFDDLEFIYTHNRLINKKHKTNLFPVGISHEDRYWNVQVFNRLTHIVNIEEVTYHYVAHSDSFSNASRAGEAYVDSAIELYERMSGLPSCWSTLKETFLVTAVEKNLYLWNYPCNFRKKAVRRILPYARQMKLNTKCFPRYTRLIHRLLQAGCPDAAIVFLSRLYAFGNALLKRPV